MGITAPAALLGEVPRERTGHPILGEHLSPSQIKTFQRCPEQWRQRYILGIKTAPGIALIHGDADHTAHEVNFRQKIASREDLPVADVTDAFSDALETRVALELEEWGEVDGVGDGKAKLGEIKDVGVRMVRAYHQFASPQIQPTHVELAISLTNTAIPVPVIGYIDVVTADLGIERKTSARASFDQSWRAQSLFYAAWLKRPVDIHVTTKAKATRVITGEWTVEATPAAIDGILELYAAVAHQIIDTAERFGLDQPWPGRITDRDACGWCGYRPRCRWWRV